MLSRAVTVPQSRIASRPFFSSLPSFWNNAMSVLRHIGWKHP